MGAVPCVLSKVCCAPFMGDARWVVGWGMTGRAEFACAATDEQSGAV